MSEIPIEAGTDAMPFTGFFFLCREYGVPVSTRDLLDLRRGLSLGLVESLDDFFIFSRLTFVRRVEHMDAFERAFALYFYGVDIPAVAPDDMELFRTKPFQKWLAEAIKSGELPRTAMWEMDPEELMRKFWDTVRKQMEAHNGGSRWVGTRGNSPWGNSGNARRGVRVGGASGMKSALKVIGERRYTTYSESNLLRSENLRQALERMKHLKKEGAYDTLNIDETIRKSAKNGGEIEFVFEPDLRDRMNLALVIDNGGYSMDPYINLTRLLFSKIRERFKEIKTYYFHNTIYGNLWTDQQRTKPLPLEKFLLNRNDMRVVIIGDASMAPEELEMPRGAISYGARDLEPSIYWHKKIQERFKKTLWLNPISSEDWGTTYGQYTLNRLRSVYRMEDMTLRGIKRMVEFLSEKG